VSSAAPVTAPSPAPSPSAPVSAATPTPSAGLTDDTRAVAVALNRYQEAFSALDVNAAHAVWPNVDVKALARAFDQLEEQTFQLEGCNITVAGARAQADCGGNARYIRKVGNTGVARRATAVALQSAADQRSLGHRRSRRALKRHPLAPTARLLLRPAQWPLLVRRCGERGAANQRKIFREVHHVIHALHLRPPQRQSRVAELQIPFMNRRVLRHKGASTKTRLNRAYMGPILLRLLH
jgi:hypothetical protein